MPDLPETPTAAEVPPLTRRQRRLEAQRQVTLPPVVARRLLPLVATVSVSALVALTGYAHPVLVGFAVGFAALVLAWGWPGLMALPSRRGTSGVLAVGAVSCVAAAALTTEDPFLRWVPAALALSLIAAFLHQLLRRDGRPRLTESVGATAAGLAIVSSGAAYVPLPRALGGAQLLAVAMAALAAASVADLATPSRRLRPWALPLGMLLGGAAATLVGLVDGRPEPATAALVGVLVAGISHATRRVLAVLPSMGSPRAQLVSGATSVLLCGVVVYALGRMLVA